MFKCYFSSITCLGILRHICLSRYRRIFSTWNSSRISNKSVTY